MMKRYISFLIALLLVFAFAGCTHKTQTAPDTLPELVLLPDEPSSGGAPASAAEPQAESPPEAPPAETPPESPPAETPESPPAEETLAEDGVYTSKEDVALYLHLYGHLPDNFITQKDAKALGWPGGSLEPYAPGKCIGGGRFGNYEGLLPDAAGRKWFECDVDTLGAKSRGAKRIVYSNDGLIYYTGDHYESFELLYGEE